MVKRFICDVIKYNKYSVRSARSELKSEVASSYLNWLWWILEPFFFMLVYVFVFAFVFKSNTKYFPAFIFIGISVWTFFNNNMISSVRIVKNNKNIVTKVYVPKFILVINKLYTNLFKMFISFSISFLLMVFYKVPITLNVFWIFPLLIELLIITFGIMTILLHFGVYVSDLVNVVRILLRMGFFLTGVFYSIDSRIGAAYPKVAYGLNNFNPIAFLLKSFRNVLLYSKGVDVKWYFVWLILGIIISFLGVKLIYKNENSYVKVI